MKKLSFAFLMFFCIFNLGENSNILKISADSITIKDVEIQIYRGIDISMYQKKVDWENFDKTISFVICKSTEGIYKIDSKFSENWNKIPVIRGAYHFFRPQFSGRTQGQLFLETVNFGDGDIRPIIDVEYTGMWKHMNNKKAVGNLIEMIDYIKEKTGIIPIIYTTGAFWERYVLPYYNSSDHLLWIADFRGNREPKIPKNYPEWNIWQYSSKGKIKGIKGCVDRNICKDLDALLIK